MKINVKERLDAIFNKLGLADKAKSNKLTAIDAAKINAEYKAEYKGDLNADLRAAKQGGMEINAFNEMMASFKELGILAGDTKDPDKTDENDPEKEDPETNNGKEDGEGGDGDKKKEEAKAVVIKVDAIVKENKDMKAQIAKLAATAAPDTAEKKVVPSSPFGMAHTEKHAFGIESPFFAMEKRYNRVLVKGRSVILESDATDEDKAQFKADYKDYACKLAARINYLHKSGKLALLKAKGENGASMDYSDLSLADLGDQFVVRRQDALIARIEQLPSLDSTFPKRSNVQDNDLITNAYLGELSQSYQGGHLTKGGVSFEPEKAHVDNVMMKYLIPSFKWIEKTYLGYLNTSGSDPIKWNMIEWLVLAMASQLQLERIQRMVRGCYVAPVAGKSGHFLNSATGLIHRLVSYIESYKILPFTESAYQSYTSATIGDVLMAFAEAVNQILPNGFMGKALYINSKHIAWYRAWYNEKYGKDNDYTGDKLMLKDYDLPIIGVPAMGNNCIFFITEEGNLQQLENVPGEMLNMKFQPDLDEIWAYSVWKEGFAAAYAGKPYTTLANLVASKRKFQSIFMNYPISALTADDTAPDVSGNFMFKSVANTKATVITDLVNAEDGRVYKLEIGNATNPISIAKTGKFSNVEAWTPTTVGSFIKLLYDSTTSKFVEVERKILTE